MANTNRKKATNAQNWKITQRYLRIEHNKIVNAWFRNASTGTTRASLRNSMLIYKKDSAIQVTAKMQFFANYINKKTDDILTLPLQYQTRPLPGVPQLAIIYRPTAKSIKVGGKVVKSFQFPITKSVAIDEVVEFFESGKGKKIGAARIVDANTGQGYPIQ